MSRDVFGDEGEVCSHGHETAAYHELMEVVRAYEKWRSKSKDEFWNDEQIAAVREVTEKLDALAETYDTEL